MSSFYDQLMQMMGGYGPMGNGMLGPMGWGQGPLQQSFLGNRMFSGLPGMAPQMVASAAPKIAGSTAAAGAGLSGLLGPAALAFAPAILGGLMNRNDPQRRMYQQYLDMQNPTNIANTANQYFNQWKQGPAYGMQNQAITAGGTAASNAMNAGLAASGGNMSGIGAMARATPSVGMGMQRAQLLGQGYQQSWQNAMQAHQGWGQGFAWMHPGENAYSNLFAGGLNAFGPMAAYKMGWLPQQRGGYA